MLIKFNKISIFCKKTVDGQKEKQSNSARLQGKAKKTVGNDLKSISNAPIAQLVEQRIENPRVPGSIPGRGTIYTLTNRKNIKNQFQS